MLKSHRGALMALGAAILLAALVFLFAKTAGIDFRQDAQALSLLREMRDLDSHWDDDAARMVNDFKGAPAQADFAAMMGRVLAEVERSVTRAPFRKELAQLRAGLTEKEREFKSLREAHGPSRVGGSRAPTHPVGNRSARVRSGSKPLRVADRGRRSRFSVPRHQ